MQTASSMSPEIAYSSRVIQVPSGKDRFGQDALMIWGLIPLTIKVSRKDSGGDLFVFEHARMGKGGPPRHLHYAQDEWFRIAEGEFAFEIGDEKFRAYPGDSVFAPRMVPHAWACVSDPGTLLTILSPAGTFEEFILETTTHPTLPSPEQVEQAFASHGMKVLGPPLRVD